MIVRGAECARGLILCDSSQEEHRYCFTPRPCAFIRKGGELIFKMRGSSLTVGGWSAVAYMVLVLLSLLTHPLLAPAISHRLECLLSGTVELGSAHGVFLGLAFLVGSLRLILKFAMSTAHTGPLVLLLFGSLLGNLMRTLVLCACLLIGFSGEHPLLRANPAWNHRSQGCLGGSLQSTMCTVALFPTFRGTAESTLGGSTNNWASPGGVMERLLQLMYGGIELDELRSASFPAISILLFAAYTLFLIMFLIHGESQSLHELDTHLHISHGCNALGDGAPLISSSMCSEYVCAYCSFACRVDWFLFKDDRV